MKKSTDDGLKTVRELNDLIKQHTEQTRIERENLTRQRESAQSAQDTARRAMNKAVSDCDGNAYHDAKIDFDKASDVLEMVEARFEMHDARNVMTAAELEAYTDRVAAELFEQLTPAIAEVEAAKKRADELADEIWDEARFAYDTLTRTQGAMCRDGKNLLSPGGKISAIKGAGVSFRSWAKNTTSAARTTQFEQLFGLGEEK